MYGTYVSNQKFYSNWISVLYDVTIFWKKLSISKVSRTFILYNNNAGKFVKNW